MINSADIFSLIKIYPQLCEFSDIWVVFRRLCESEFRSSRLSECGSGSSFEDE
jgi:hypothetical protein